MKINTLKIRREMQRLEITYGKLGFRMGMSRQAAWSLIRNAEQMRSVEKIARALDMDAKDLLK